MVELDEETIDGKELISNALVRIYENYGVEDRKRLEEFEEGLKKLDFAQYQEKQNKFNGGKKNE